MTYLEFELILLSYLVMAMIIQYMNIYKAVSTLSTHSFYIIVISQYEDSSLD